MVPSEDQEPPPPGRQSVALWVGSAALSQMMASRIATFLGVPDLILQPVRQSLLSANLLEKLRPSIAFSLLTWPGGDALETAVRLKESGFSGGYRAFSHGLPDKTLIEREIRMQAPGLDFSIIDLAA